MALDAYILINQAGKAFEGTANKTGFPKGSSIVHAAYHSLETPVDIAHGAVTHRRQHGLLVVEMLIDASVYQIFNAIIDKDKDGSKKVGAEIGFFRPDQANIGLKGFGETKPYYKIIMTDGFIASCEFVMGDTRSTGGPAGAAAAGRQEYLKVKFAYRQIEWMYCDGNKSAQDAWDAK